MLESSKQAAGIGRYDYSAVFSVFCTKTSTKFRTKKFTSSLSYKFVDCVSSFYDPCELRSMCSHQPNSREKMHDFTAEFLKCVKFHGKFTGPRDVILRCCANANEEISEQKIFTTLSQDSRQSMSAT